MALSREASARQGKASLLEIPQGSLMAIAP